MLRAVCFLLVAGPLGALGGAFLAGRADEMQAVTTAAGLVLGDTPETASLTPLPGFAPALRAGQSQGAPVVLAIEGITGEPAQPVRIHVFVGKPDATPKTSTDDPHFVGYIAVIPKYAVGHAQGIDVSRAFDISHLGISPTAQSITVTLVPVAGVAEAPRGLSLRVRKIYFRRD